LADTTAKAAAAINIIVALRVIMVHLTLGWMREE
jgi:hypothetical protein